MRIGLHLHSTRSADAVVDYCRKVRPPIMKMLHPDRELVLRCKDASPGTRWIGRIVDPNDLRDYDQYQAKVLSAAKTHPEIDAWEGVNEPAERGDGMRELARKEVGLAKRLNDLGKVACIGGFSTGFIESDDDFEPFRAALEYCHAHPNSCWLHFHEYSAPYMQFGVITPDGKNQFPKGQGPFTGFSVNREDYYQEGLCGWLTLRYRMLRRKLVEEGLPGVNFVITESGIDGGVRGRPGPGGGGWRDFDTAEWTPQSVGDYSDQMHWYAWHLSCDPFVVGAVDFGFGSIDPTWHSFGLDREETMLKACAEKQTFLPVGTFAGSGVEPVPLPHGEPEPPPRPIIQGIDVSRWQGHMDWGKAKTAGAVFAWIKASEGTTWQDPNYRENAEGAGAAGLVWGPYHYFRNAYDPTAQAEQFARVVLNASDTNRSLPPAIDLEDTSHPLDVAALETFVGYVAEWIGRPIIYTANWWIAQQEHVRWLGNFPLWVAHYGTDAPLVPAPWDDWNVWQWASHGHGPTYGASSEHIDRNKFRGSLNDLVALAGTPPTTKPGPDPVKLRAALEAEHMLHGIRYNPDAAISRAMWSDGYWPTTNEIDACGVVAQRGEGVYGVRVYYWDGGSVRWV